MAKGKTISITLPEKVVSYYENKAKEMGMSRSSVICDIVIANYESKVNQENIINVTPSSSQTENS